mgnify:CR=1 FL=1
MNSVIIEILEEKRNKLRNEVMKKKIFSTKMEKEILKKYDELLLEQYTKFCS